MLSRYGRRQRKLLIGMALVMLVNTLLAMWPRPTYAIQTFVQKAKSDCASIEANISLLYTRDDDPDKDVARDYFKLDVYDGTKGQWLTGIEESITWEQSPFYWQTNRLDAAAFDGVYNIRLYDSDADGRYQDFIESYYYDCKNNTRWWDTTSIDGDSVYDPTCINGMRVYTTNRAPEDGAVVITWSWEPSYKAVDYHVDTIRIPEGHLLTYDEFPVPCGVYIKLYYQPDSTKLLYLMPSQYWPHDAFGTSPDEDASPDDQPVYYTVFPLDGEERGEGEDIPRAPYEGNDPVGSAEGTEYKSGSFTLSPKECADFDDGDDENCGSDSDVRWYIDDEDKDSEDQDRELRTQNGAKLRVMGSSKPDYNTCRTASLSGSDIDADEEDTKIPDGTYLCFRTDEDRYGYIHIDDYGEDLRVDFVTWEKDGD